MKRVLVTGATGNVGRPTLEALRALGIEARAAVRPGSAEAVGDAVPLDFADGSTWEGALDGVDGVDGLFLLRPPAVSDVGRTLNAFVDRGRATLKHVVYVPAGRGRASWVDTRDIGEAAARAFVEADARGRAWLLTGPETRSFGEVAALLTEALGRPVRYDAASVPGYLRHLTRRRGLPWSRAAVYTVLHLAIRMGAEERVDSTLARVLGRRPRSIADTIRDHLELWR